MNVFIFSRLTLNKKNRNQLIEEPISMKYFIFIRKQLRSPRAGMIYIVFLTLSVLSASTSRAQGDLLLYPKRIVFEGTKRTQELNLANSGKDTARYVLSVVQIRMKEDGSFENITEPDSGQNFADKYFRIFPRKVVLPPNEAQTVKIQLSNTGELQPGEYRSHLYIRAEPEKQPLGEEDPPKDQKNIEVKLLAVFGISIPVIIRQGENTAAVNLSDASFRMEDTTPLAQFTLNRSGNMSVYGAISIDHISPQGKITHVAGANGLAVYTPTQRRNLTLPLEKHKDVNYYAGSLHIVYSYQGSKPAIQAEQYIKLN